MRILYKALDRAGLQMAPYHDTWTWRDAVKPRADGSQNTVYLWDYIVVVTAAAMLTADTCGWINGVLGQLHRKAGSPRSLADLTRWIRRKKDVLLRQLSNTDAVQREGVAFGAMPRDAAARAVAAAIQTMVAAPSNEALHDLTSALATLAPRTCVAGFYERGASGPMGQFMMHLREGDLPYEEIAALVETLSPRASFETQGAYEQHYVAAVGAVKRQVNRAKAKQRQDLEDDGVLEKRAQNVPRHRRWAVLFSVSVPKLSTVTIHL